MAPFRGVWSSTLQGVEEDFEAEEEDEEEASCKAVWYQLKDADAAMLGAFCPIPEQTPEHSEVDLDDMYDFTRFVGGQSPAGPAPEKTTGRVQELERQLEEQRRWAEVRFEEHRQQLEKAGRARERAQNRVQQLEAALSLRTLESFKLQAQVEQLDELLANKESLLQAAPVDAEAVKGQLALQEAPSEAAEQMQLLAQVAEELTDALERSNAAELEAKAQLARVKARLDGQVGDCERVRAELVCEASKADALARAREEELTRALRSQEAEYARLDAEVAAAGCADLARERAYTLELEDRVACVEEELDLQMALSAKGKSLRWRSIRV